MLRYIVAGDGDRSGTYKDVLETLRDLQDRHLIEQRGGRLEPTPDVVFSLRLDDFDDDTTVSFPLTSACRHR